MEPELKMFELNDGEVFPNNHLPILLYKGVLNLPVLFPATHVINLFKKNNWYNAWIGGIFNYHHYHSNTHEVLGIYGGSTTLLLKGEDGLKITVKKGDVLIIPAGVAQKNLGDKNAVKCIGAYPFGSAFDMNYGKPGERPRTDKNIAAVPIPSFDPVYGTDRGLSKIWGYF